MLLIKLLEMKPRISVIMGIYNCASTLPKALDSLFSQTYKEFKVILCDDGSTDDTFIVARLFSSAAGSDRFAQCSDRRRVCHHLSRERRESEALQRSERDDA